MAEHKDVPEKEYPPKMDYSTVLRGMGRVSLLDTTFHVVMAILLITGLIIDLLGPWLGGWLFVTREILHGYFGALFVFVFIAYLAHIAFSKKMRTVLTVTNYVDLIFYTILVTTGVTIAAANEPWIDLVPWLSNALSPIGLLAPVIHVTVTYVWILFSLIFPGGFLHGLASVYLISHLKKRSKMRTHE